MGGLRKALVALVFTGVLTTSAISAERTIVQVRFPSFAAMDAFFASHPHAVARTERRILGPELELSSADLADLDALGHAYRVVAPLATGSGAGAEAQPGGTNQKTSHYRYQEQADTLMALAARHPGIARHMVLGVSAAGLPIHALKISDHPEIDEDEATALFVGVHHADEAVGVDVVIAVARRLLASYGQEPAVTAHVDGSEIWAVPLLNPDGWMLLEDQTLRAWRKNRRDNNGDGCFDSGDGVDLNRNYDFNWLLGGSAVPSQFAYRGPEPFSEPETRLLRDLMLATRPSLALSYHQSGEVVIVPWTWNGTATPDSATYRAIAGELAGALQRLDGAAYDWFEEDGSGGYLEDWLYGTQGGFAFTIEVTTPDAASIDLAVERNVPGALQALARLSGGQVTGRVSRVASGSPAEAEVAIEEIDTFALSARRSDPATGRFRRLLEAGAYTLKVSAPGCFPERIPFTVVAGLPTTVDVSLRDSALVTAVDPDPRRRHGLTIAPNPVRGGALLRFGRGSEGSFELALFDLAGRRRRVLGVRGRADAGVIEARWDGRDQEGRILEPGIYVWRLSGPGVSVAIRTAVVR